MTGEARDGWAGSVVAGPGRLEFHGAIGAASGHEHAAVQVLLVTQGEVALRDASGAERVVASAVVPAGVRHELLASPDAHGTVVLLDATSRTGRAAARRVADADLNPGGVDAWLADVDVATRLTMPGPGPDTGHPAVAEVLRMAPEMIAGPMPLGEVAARVGLSASRLGHVFAEQVGVPYPAWRRWLRLQHALGVVRAGGSLTTAAHQAGFADSAHLTRSCRATFGITPTEGVRAAGDRT